MQLNTEEDEKTNDPFLFDERISEATRRVFEQKSEELTKVFTPQFIDLVLQSEKAFSGVSKIRMNQSNNQTNKQSRNL